MDVLFQVKLEALFDSSHIILRASILLCKSFYLALSFFKFIEFLQ